MFMDHTELVNKFYKAFSSGDYKGMADCYHKDIVFEDPAFGVLKGNRAAKMWEMLLTQNKGSLKITYDTIQTRLENGSAHWTAQYTFGAKNRKVTNVVYANFKFKEGKIVAHTDVFDVWRWSQQALGLSGYVLGWTPFMKNKIQKTAQNKLDKFIQKSLKP